MVSGTIFFCVPAPPASGVTTPIRVAANSINSLKHHVTATYRSQFLKNIKQSIVYKFAERTNGESYSVIDAKITLDLKSLELSVIGNNIFNEAYTETNLVHMPKGNVLLDLRYKF